MFRLKATLTYLEGTVTGEGQSGFVVSSYTLLSLSPSSLYSSVFSLIIIIIIIIIILSPFLS